MSAVLDAALQYAGRGWSVFPGVIIDGAKKSHVSGKYSNGNRWGASNKPRVLMRYWRRWPDALIDLPTGRENGIFVIDVDTMDGHGVNGVANFAAFVHHFGKLPPTLMAMSPSGSTHYYFKYPKSKRLSIRTDYHILGPKSGVDVRGDAGMVLVPPSRTHKGVYRWLNDLPIAEAPKWLLDKVRKPSVRRKVVTSNNTVEHPDIDLIKYALDVIIEGCSRTSSWPYKTWRQVCCALHKELGDDPFDLFDEWSSRSPTYVHEQCVAKWDNCGWEKFNYRAATIFHFAGLADPGWRVSYEARLWQKVATALQQQHRQQQ